MGWGEDGDWVLAVLNASQPGVCALNLLPTSSTGRLPGGGDFWAVCGWPRGRNKKSGLGSEAMSTVGTALTGEGELALSCLWRTVAVGKASYSGLGTGKAPEYFVFLPGGGEGHSDLLLSQKSGKAN